jgi:hypothetical protein
MFIDRGTPKHSEVQKAQNISLASHIGKTFRSPAAGAISSNQQSINIPSRDWVVL